MFKFAFEKSRSNLGTTLAGGVANINRKQSVYGALYTIVMLKEEIPNSDIRTLS